MNSAPDLNSAEAVEDSVMAQERGEIDRIGFREDRNTVLAQEAAQQQSAEVAREAAKIEEAETNKKIAFALAELKKKMDKAAPDSLDFT